MAGEGLKWWEIGPNNFNGLDARTGKGYFLKEHFLCSGDAKMEMSHQNSKLILFP